MLSAEFEAMIRDVSHQFAQRLVQEAKLMDTMEALIRRECDIADELAVIVIQCDEIIHTNERPFCEDKTCPCHCIEAMTEFIEHPILEGLLTGDEAARLWRGEQV